MTRRNLRNLSTRTRVLMIGAATIAVVAGGVGVAHAAEDDWGNDTSSSTSSNSSVSEDTPYSSDEPDTEDAAMFDEEGLVDGDENTPHGGVDPTWVDDADSEDTYTTEWGDPADAEELAEMGKAQKPNAVQATQKPAAQRSGGAAKKAKAQGGARAKRASAENDDWGDE